MINRRLVLYAVVLACVVTLVLALIGLVGLAVAALAVAVLGAFGWVVLWARAQNAQLARIGTTIERQHAHARERTESLADAIEDLDARVVAANRDMGGRATGQQDRIARLHRDVLDLTSLLQRTPSATVELYRTYRRLVPDDHPMPTLGGFAMTASTLVWITDQISSGRFSTIMECGSGSSTVWFALALEQRGGMGHIVSLESDAEYAEETRRRLAERGLSHRATVLTAPLVPLELPGRPPQPWFDLSDLPADLAGVELLFVDGPLGSSSPLARYPALPVLADRLAEDAVVVLDDSSRAPEQQILQLWTSERSAGRRFAITQELDRATVLGPAIARS